MVRELSPPGFQVRRGVSCLDVVFLSQNFLLFLNELCSYFACCYASSRAGSRCWFLGRVTESADFTSGSTPPQPSIEELLLIRLNGLSCSSRYTRAATCLLAWWRLCRVTPSTSSSTCGQSTPAQPRMSSALPRSQDTPLAKLKCSRKINGGITSTPKATFSLVLLSKQGGYW